MKKTLISLAVLGAVSGVAHAQSSVTIYGIVDAGLVSERGGKAGNVTKVTSGVGSASRIGFRGTEDLGGGLSAVFTLEGGFAADTGVGDAAGLFQRQAFVGLVSKDAGSLTLGRQYSPIYNALSQVADPFAAGLAGSAKNLFGSGQNAAATPNIPGGNVRYSNAINYKSVNMSGFAVELQYGVGEQTSSNAGRQLGAGLSYENGPLNVRVAYNNRNNNTVGVAPVGIGHNTLVAANYNFNVVKGFVAYESDRGAQSSPIPAATAYTAVAVPASKDSDTLLVGLTAPVGANGTVIASFIRKDDNEAANRDADQWALGYTYALSKRTNTYVAYAKIKNKNGASYTVGNNSEAGSGNKAFNLGIKHTF